MLQRRFVGRTNGLWKDGDSRVVIVPSHALEGTRVIDKRKVAYALARLRTRGRKGNTSGYQFEC